MLFDALLVGLKYLLEERDQLPVLTHLEFGTNGVILQEMRVLNDFEAVALVDQELLPLISIEHLMSVSGDERIKVGVVVIVLLGEVGFLLGS